MTQQGLEEYKRAFQATLDALYAKEIQDIHSSYLDPSKNLKERTNELHSSLSRFHLKIANQKFKSAPLTICILNVCYQLSLETRNNLDMQIIVDLKNTITSVYDLFKHFIIIDEHNTEDELIIGDKDDLERILYLIFESCFNLAHDGIKYRKSKEIFNMGVSLLARIVGKLKKNNLEESFNKYQSRYDQLENSINDSGVDVDKLKECLRLLKDRFISDQRDEQMELEKQLREMKFNIY